jgi:hypothetical protein
MSKCLLLTISIFCGLTATAMAADPVDPNVFIKDLGDATLRDVRCEAVKRYKEQKPMSYHSTAEEEKSFSMTYMPSNSDKFFFVHSDDGFKVVVIKNGEPIYTFDRLEQYQHLPALSQSLHLVPFVFREGETYGLVVYYKNKLYRGTTDIDGITVFAINLPLQFKVLPSDASVVSADDRTSYIVASVFVRDASDPSALIPVNDGSVVEWEIKQGNGTLSTPQSTTKDGLATVALYCSGTAGATYRVEGKLKRVNWLGKTLQCDVRASSGDLTVIPGMPANVVAIKTTNEYVSDGTGTADIEATIKDSSGNLVADGTNVSWLLNCSTGEIRITRSETQNGKVTATVVAPVIPDDQTVVMASGVEESSQSIVVSRVNGILTPSAQSVAINSGQAVQIIATVDAAEGTPVFWMSSNGLISGDSYVINGQATALLSTESGRLGPAIVTATIGDRILHTQVEFIRGSGVAIGVERFVLAGDETSDGVETITWADGTMRPWPYFASSRVWIAGPPNGRVYVVVSDASLVFASGLNTDSSIDLDAQGNGEFYLYSRGAVTTDDIPSVTITAQLVQPLGEQQSAAQNSPAQEDEAEVVVKLPKRGLWTNCLDAVGGFFGADTETGWGLTAGVTGSLLMVGDVGATVKNLWRMTGFSDRDPNYIELGLSGFGIISTLGSPLVDGPIAVARSLAAKLGRLAGKSKFLEVLIKTTRHADDLPVAELTRRNAFCQLIRRDADAITVFDAVVKEGAEVTVSKAAKVSEKLGQQFVDTIKSIATNPKYGAKTAQRTVHVLGELSDEVLVSLKASGRFSEAVDGLASVLKKGAKKGVNPEMMKAVLHNDAVYSAAYKHADLLTDLGKIADADGIEVLISRLKNQI